MVFCLIFPTFYTWLYFVVFAGTDTAKIIYSCGKVFQFLLPFLWLWLQKRDFPKRQNEQTKKLTESLIFGLLSGGTIVGVYWFLLSCSPTLADAPQKITTRLNDFGLNSPSGFLILAIFYSLFHSLLEEMYWRWFLFREWRNLLGPLKAGILSSVGFMAHHIIIAVMFIKPLPLALALTSAVGIGGAIWCWLYQRSQRLIGPWLSHAMIDAALILCGYFIVWGSC